MTVPNTVMQFAKDQEAMYIETSPDWNGKKMWLMVFYDPYEEEIPIIGTPQYIEESQGNVRLVFDEEAEKYLHYLSKNYEYDEDDEMIGFDSKLVKVE